MVQSSNFINRSITVLVIGVVLCVVAAPYETDVALRSPGTVGEHFHTSDVIERAIKDLLKVLFRTITLFGLSALVCTTVGVSGGAIGAIGCLAISGFTALYAVSRRFRTNVARATIDAGEPTHWQDLYEHHYPTVENGDSVLSQLVSAYNGSSALPVMTCLYPGLAGCHDVTYRNYAKPGTQGGLYHHISVSQSRASTTAKRFECNGNCYGEGTAAEDGSDQEYYSDYYFDQGEQSDDYTLAVDPDSGGLPQHVSLISGEDVFIKARVLTLYAKWLDAFNAQSDPDPSAAGGIYCSNMEYSCEKAAVGFMVGAPTQMLLSQDEIAGHFATCEQFYDDVQAANCIRP